MSVARGIVRIVCYLLGFLFLLAVLGGLFFSPSVGAGLILFGFILIAIGKVLRAPEVVGAPLTQVNVYQQAAPPMIYAPQAPVQQTYMRERETVKVRCRNCGSL